MGWLNDLFGGSSATPVMAQPTVSPSNPAVGLLGQTVDPERAKWDRIGQMLLSVGGGLAQGNAQGMRFGDALGMGARNWQQQQQTMQQKQLQDLLLGSQLQTAQQKMQARQQIADLIKNSPNGVPTPDLLWKMIAANPDMAVSAMPLLQSLTDRQNVMDANKEVFGGGTPSVPSAPNVGVLGNPDFNIGNVRTGGGNWQGVGTPQNGFEAPNSPEAGVRMNALNLRAIGQKLGPENFTIANVAPIWAPAGDKNDPVAWMNTVSKVSGLPVDIPINISDPQQAAKLMMGINVTEKGKPTVPPQAYAAGVQLAQSGGPLPASPQAPQQPPQQAPAPQGATAGPQGQAYPPQVQAAFDAMKQQAAQYRAYAQSFANHNLPTQANAYLQKAMELENTISKQQIEYSKPLVNINNAGETESQKIAAQNANKAYSSLQDAAANVPKQQAQWDQMNALLEGIQTGKFSNFMAETTKTLRGLGIDPASLGLTDTSSRADAVNALSNKMALDARTAGGGNNMPGQMSDADRRFLVQMVPGLETTPEGRKLMTDFNRRMNQFVVRQAKAVDDFVQKNGGAPNSKIYEIMRQYADEHPIFSQSDVDAVLKAQQSAPGQPGQTQNAPAPNAPKQILRFDAQGNLIQ